MWLVGVLFVIFAWSLFINIEKSKQGRTVYAADWFATVGGTIVCGYVLLEQLVGH